MRALVKALLLFVWLVGLPVCATEWVIQYPQFVPFPESLAEWLFDQYRRTDPFEDGYGFGLTLCCLILMHVQLLALLIATWIWRRHRARKRGEPLPAMGCFGKAVCWGTWLVMWASYITHWWLGYQHGRIVPTEAGTDLGFGTRWLLSLVVTVAITVAGRWLWCRHRRSKSARQP